ncbi:sugar kinase [Fictibacillus phosphorivorans]|uniref:sugar kinase n=1 Tax=Fictibacillus phosphorivorans TaxID=1221500 RepID=UPI00203C72C7|nr:sugar kinase [Fictibacillus phosphorivorans]MCM3719016.1 sugar kinase [Fictibacillus phosphorivorans]MCM3776638.1 sugar kinase [Fictibacillus phosphorivorans]
MKNMDIITFGEAMTMFIADQVGELHEVPHFTRSLAGAETNVAIGLARLGYKVCFLSKVGNDPFGQYILDSLQKEKIDTDAVRIVDSHPTGFQLKSKVTSGDPSVHYFRKNSAASTMSVQDFHHYEFEKSKHLHLTGIPPALSETAREFAHYIIDTMKEHGKTVSFDPNLRPNLWGSQDEMTREINKLAFKADWVLPGIEEGEILTGFRKPEEIADFYLNKGVKLVVIKLGEEGAYFKTNGGTSGLVPGFPVREVVDTVGAGDGFAVGLISGLLDQSSIPDSVTRGNAIGAMQVQSPGDSDGLPDLETLQTFIAKRECLQ